MEFPKAVLSTHHKTAALQAFNKLFWLQQDLFQRHYVRTDEEAAVHLAKVRDKAHAELLAEKVGEVRLDDSAGWGKGRREDSSDEEETEGEASSATGESGVSADEAQEAARGLPEVDL